MTDRDLLANAIKRSGLSARAFARDVLWRDERTVRRWLSGESPVPAVVADRLREKMAPRSRVSPSKVARGILFGK
jgi:hypothetical protein